MARHWKFSSKRLGLEMLHEAVKGTGARALGFQQMPRNGRKQPNLARRGNKILVRLDQANKRQWLTDNERRKQPREHFENTKQERARARAFIAQHSKKYSLVVHHISRPREDVITHGRVFIDSKGTVWVHLSKSGNHSSFSRWKHELVSKYSISNPEKATKPEKLSAKAFAACQKVAKNIFQESQRRRITPIRRANFVIYKDAPNHPEFYDLLFIQGLRKPSSNIF